MDKIDARTLPQEVLEHLRRQAFLLREKGYTWAHIAEVCGVNIWTVMNWSRRAREEGKAENAEIYWGDETAIRQDTHWVRGYAPAGQTPLLRTRPRSGRAPR